MKNAVLSMLFLVGVLMGTTAFVGKDKEVKIKTSAQCEECKERIEKNLTLTKGVKEAVLNLDDKVVTVKYNSKKIDEAAIIKVITDIGYDANSVPANPIGYNKLPTCCQKGGHPSGMNHDNH
jgi:periplasmic mercuric ion binding protein